MIIIPTHHQSQQDRTSEAGNVLFLILIAVALFAALSYAVTQSTRSGGGDANNETNLVNSAQITQYPAGIKTSITRMIVSNGVTAEELEFNAPAAFSSLTSNNVGVFHPSGGGATYAFAPDSVVDTTINATKAWVFNTENEVQNIGQTDAAAPTHDTADTIAFLPGVKLAICQKIHAQLGLATTFSTDETGINYVTQQTDAVGTATDHILTNATNGTIGALATELVGQPQGCFKDGTTYVYYHVLIER